MSGGRSNVAALVVVAIIFVVTVQAVLLAFLFAPEGRDLTLVIGPLLALIPSTIAAIALLQQMGSVKSVQAEQSAKLDKVAKDTHDLTNGLLDSKVRAGVADVIRPQHIDPEAQQLLELDRAARARSHDTEHETRPE